MACTYTFLKSNSVFDELIYTYGFGTQVKHLLISSSFFVLNLKRTQILLLTWNLPGRDLRSHMFEFSI